MSLKLRLSALVSKDAKLRYGIFLIEVGDDPAKGFALLSALAKQNVVEAQFRVGKSYLEGLGVPPSLEDGTRWIRRAAQAGHVQAQFILATLYTIGFPEGFDENSTTLLTNVAQLPKTPDFHQAAIWARKSAEAGFPDAQALLGYVLTNGPADLVQPSEGREWFEKAAKAGSAQGSLGLGMALLYGEERREEDKQRGIAALEKATAAGLATPFYLLAQIHEHGNGKERDLGAAARCYQEAAERGIVAAQARFGLFLLEGRGIERNISRAETWLRRAALGGDVESAALLGDIYVRGDDLAPNYLEAATWYRLAAENGHAAAARGLGLLYLTGTGVHRDPNEAARWFRLSAENGDRVADADLGNLALSGAASDEDKQAMRDRFEKAAEAGDLVSAFNLGVCLAEGVGVPRDERQAAYWMQRAAEGIVNAQYWLGRMYIEGRGFDVNIEEGCRWLEKAATAGMTDAQTLLGQMLVTGRAPGGKNHARALELYREAATHGHVGAMFSAGALYGGGHDVPADRPEALRWFLLAAERGNPLAQLMAGRYLTHGLAGKTDLAAGRKWLERAKSQGVSDAEAELKNLEKSASNGG
ncbi:tetratricopeptide repeat protein [Kozakia baliensis]|uniref:tetratricopeptide repeat protein n=1 Tax=Kozakia baliensis TaxID=153496 RepID=UPI00345BFB6B